MPAHERTYAAMLALALGRPPVCLDGIDWAAVFTVAGIESCAALCWQRSGDLIRAHAPASVVERWRSAALMLAVRAEEQLEWIGEVVGPLEAAGAEPLILKGLPLAQRLYGTVTSRPTNDIDLFVASPRRDAARDALRASGWEVSFGRPPLTEVFLRREGPVHARIEVQSLFGEELLHLDAPEFPVETIQAGGMELPALGLPLLPAYVAVHLARHEIPALLLTIDLLTLWNGLSEAERAAAVAAAEGARVHRYLRAALRLASLIPRAAEEDSAALRAFGVRAEGRAAPHPFLFLLLHSGSMRDAAKMLQEAVYPTWMKGPAERAIGGSVFRRLSSKLRWHTLMPLRRTFDPHVVPSRSSTDALAVDEPALIELVQSVLERDGSICVRASGWSMVPTMADGTVVRLAAVTPGSLRVGDVVLAQLPERVVMHRVQNVAGDVVVLRGDSMLYNDPPIGAAAILARVVAVRRGDEELPLRRRAPVRFRGAARRLLATRAYRQYLATSR